jgi:hypothetical protein
MQRKKGVMAQIHTGCYFALAIYIYSKMPYWSYPVTALFSFVCYRSSFVLFVSCNQHHETTPWGPIKAIQPLLESRLLQFIVTARHVFENLLKTCQIKRALQSGGAETR